jgi:hypothetical protein
LDGTLESLAEVEKKAFEEYIEKMKSEELEENEQNPIKLEDSPYFSFVLEGLNRICFSTADNPFYKMSVSKYYPEVVVMDADGNIKATINPKCRKDEALQLRYNDDFRDNALKINDDKKIMMGLSALKKPGTSIFLLVRENDLTGKPVKEGDFDRAWFRVSNDDTNQTLDYSLLSKIAKPEEYQPTFTKEGDEEGAPA